MENTPRFISGISRGVRLAFLHEGVEISVQRDGTHDEPQSITLDPAEMDAIARRWLQHRLVDSEMRE